MLSSSEYLSCYIFGKSITLVAQKLFVNSVMYKKGAIEGDLTFYKLNLIISLLDCFITTFGNYRDV